MRRYAGFHAFHIAFLFNLDISENNENTTTYRNYDN